MAGTGIKREPYVGVDSFILFHHRNRCRRLDCDAHSNGDKQKREEPHVLATIPPRPLIPLQLSWAKKYRSSRRSSSRNSLTADQIGKNALSIHSVHDKAATRIQALVRAEQACKRWVFRTGGGLRSVHGEIGGNSRGLYGPSSSARAPPALVRTGGVFSSFDYRKVN